MRKETLELSLGCINFVARSYKYDQPSKTIKVSKNLKGLCNPWPRIAKPSPLVFYADNLKDAKYQPTLLRLVL